MKTIMLSIQPHWLEKIINGEKTLEIRRNRPNLEPPFRVVMYCTKNRNVHDLLEIHVDGKIHKANGKVAAEFICDNIQTIDVPYPAYQSKLDPDILKRSCVTYYALHRYAFHDAIYGWNITDVKVYDKPKELSDFRLVTAMSDKRLVKPPQSWCYVEELQDG